MNRSSDSYQKSLLVTGASTGIGKACALHMDSLGWQVFAGIRNQANADDLRERASPNLVPVYLDLTDQVSVRTSVEIIGAALGDAGLDGLVNNAGIVTPGPIEFISISDLRYQLEVNVIGQVAVTQAFLPCMRRAGGRIINISSISGRIASPFLGPYAASKFALEAISDSLRVELRPWRIFVSIIEPGSIYTPIWEKSLAWAEERLKSLPPQAHYLYGPAMDNMKRVTMKVGRGGLPAEVVARTVAHALTARRPKARYIVGWTAKIAILVAKVAPEWLLDWFIAKRLGI